MKQFFVQLLILTTFYNYSHLYETPTEFPTTLEFLSMFFNSSRVDDVVKDFSFFPNVSKNLIHYYYFVPNSKNKTQEICAQNASEVLDKSKNLVIIIHGWLATGRDPWVYSMAHEYYSNKELSVNVVSLDWSEYSDKAYVTDAKRVKALGKLLAEFVQELAKDYLKLPQKLHLIGHSLGAHIAGFAGQYLKKSNDRVRRITGLDAAAPLFTYPVELPDNKKLSKDDAQYVSFIHTSIIFIGVTLAHGRTDFYMNWGGPIQPQCSYSDVIDAFLCSHLMSTTFFLNSINNPKRYLGVGCKNPDIINLALPALCSQKVKVSMGEFTPNSAQGVYYVNDATGNFSWS